MIGTVLGNRYRLDELIGEGGMALVYSAEYSLLQRPVAIKVLRPQFASDVEFVERFRREAQAAARFSHPNVVNVYDVGQDQGMNYIVMEYVRGENLKDLIKKEAPFTVARALNIARQICEALHHAHQNNIVHRDIKPHNILITPEGRVKVTDFGIARAASSSTLTQNGSVLGSVQYFSPEQAKGAPAGVASDIYSLGCVIYEMLTGTVPFKGESADRHRPQAPAGTAAPMRELRPGLPPAVESLVARSLAKDPSLRFPSALSMLKEIQTALGQFEARGIAPDVDLPTQVLPVLNVPERPDRRTLWVLLGLIGLVMVSAAVFFWWWLYGSVLPSVRVPNLTGLRIDDARERAREDEFRLHETWRNAEDPRGTVLRQDPEAGIMVKVKSIKVWVSRGPEEVEVPDLRGRTAGRGPTTLEDLGLATRKGKDSETRPSMRAWSPGRSPGPGERVPRGNEFRST